MEYGDLPTDWGPQVDVVHWQRDFLPSFLECYIRLISDDLEAKPFRMFMLDDGKGVGVSTGYLFERGIPVIFHIRLGNEWQGLNDIDILEFECFLRFEAHAVWDEDSVYP